MEASPAATVVVLRPVGRGPGRKPDVRGASASTSPLVDGGFETLLLRRDSRLAFHGGDWVFPGGRVDDVDRAQAAANEPTNKTTDDTKDELDAARHAGSREVAEEAGIRVEPAALIPLSHWTTPDGLPRKFSTWFFVTHFDGDAEVRIDDVEIREHRWQTPQVALAAQRTGTIGLPGPTFVTLTWLAKFASLGSALENFRRATPPFITPRPVLCPGGRVSLLPGDAGYESGDIDALGPRHRTWFLDSGWRYEKRG